MDWSQTIQGIAEKYSNAAIARLNPPSAVVMTNPATGLSVTAGQPVAVTAGHIFGLPEGVVIGGAAAALLLVAYLVMRKK